MPGGPTGLESLPSVSCAVQPDAPKRRRPAKKRTAVSAAAYLWHAAKHLGRSLEAQDILDCMVDLCVPALGEACCVYLLGDGSADGQVVATKHVDPAREQLLESLAQRAFSQPKNCQPLLEVAANRRPAVLSSLKTAALVGDGRPAHILQSDLHLKTAVLVPVANGEHVFGITICMADSTRRYTPRHVRIARELCDHFALALIAAQTYAACKRAEDTTQDLLATAIHDLMSPLTYIKGSARLLRRADWSSLDPVLTTELDLRLNAIDAAVTRMASALSAAMESTRPKPTTLSEPRSAQSNNLVMLAREVIALEQMVAPEHLIRLSYEHLEALNGKWDGDQVRQMLANLISNAVKYSRAGAPVDVRLSCQTMDGRLWAVICVADEGIGIPAGDLPFIFEPFHRGTNVSSVTGTGLGLAIVAQTLRAHNGRLWIESKEGTGTSITVSLPLQPAGANGVTRPRLACGTRRPAP